MITNPIRFNSAAPLPGMKLIDAKCCEAEAIWSIVLQKRSLKSIYQVKNFFWTKSISCLTTPKSLNPKCTLLSKPAQERSRIRRCHHEKEHSRQYLSSFKGFMNIPFLTREYVFFPHGIHCQIAMLFQEVSYKHPKKNIKINLVHTC